MHQNELLQRGAAGPVATGLIHQTRSLPFRQATGTAAPVLQQHARSRGIGRIRQTRTLSIRRVSEVDPARAQVESRYRR